jgi:hypothetical protein
VPIVPTGAPRTVPVAWPASGQCKWPIGDPCDEGFAFCCLPAALRADGEPDRWCVGHNDIGYRHQSPSQKGVDNLARSLKRYL